MQTISEQTADLRLGKTTSRTLVEACLDRIADPAGEGARVFTRIDAEAARRAADASDRLRAAGVDLSPLMGVPVSVKDLFDVAGQVTTAGSKALRQAPPARRDAPVVARLRQAGAVIVGRTNMTEFAFSGLGLNPIYGTPANPFDRTARRIPGGSSSGAAVSVTDGMATAAVGTDTGGSVRIPAALCGLTGFKPTARRVPLEGVFPLAKSLDSVGPLAPSVACCAVLDGVMAGMPAEGPGAMPLDGLRLLVPQNYVLDAVEPDVGAAFERGVRRLAEAGARIVERRFGPFDAVPSGPMAAVEAYTHHRALLADRGSEYDPRVAVRLRGGQGVGAADYIDFIEARRRFMAAMEAALLPFDAALWPTTPITAPPIADLEDDDRAYFTTNALMLRNTSVVNAMDGCALSVPCHRKGEAPVGLMIAACAGRDAAVLRIGHAVEAALAPLRRG